MQVRHALVGGFTSPARAGRARGLSLLRCGAAGAQVLAELALPDPSWLAPHPRLAHLAYVGHSDADCLSLVGVDADQGRLTLLQQQRTGGFNTVHLACAPDGRAVVTTSFASGHVSLHPVAADGWLAPPAAVLRLEAAPGPRAGQTGCQPHQACFSPDGRFVCVPDRGADCIWVLAVDTARGTLEPVGRASARPGSGPRHMLWHPTLPLAYVVHELDSSVAVHRWDPLRGALEPLSGAAALPAGFGGHNISAAICIAPDGRWLYLSNRGQDAVAIFSISADGGRLAAPAWTPGVGAMPRCMALAGGILWVASHGSDELRLFDADPQTGALRERACIATPSPACVLPWGRPAGQPR